MQLRNKSWPGLTKTRFSIACPQIRHIGPKRVDCLKMQWGPYQMKATAAAGKDRVAFIAI